MGAGDTYGAGEKMGEDVRDPDCRGRCSGTLLLAPSLGWLFRVFKSSKVPAPWGLAVPFS
jgi:hypothetical protein